MFPHEVRNVPNFKNHRNIGPDGKAKYPLPDEGQPKNIPKLLGGKKGDDPDEAGERKPEDTKYWDEGWYLWMGKGRWIAHERTGKMMLDLEHQHRLETLKGKKRKEATAEVGNKKSNEQVQTEGAPPKKWGYVIPRYQSPRSDLELRCVVYRQCICSLTTVVAQNRCCYLSHQISLHFGIG